MLTGRLRERHPEIPDDIDTIVYVDTTDRQERVFRFIRLAVPVLSLRRMSVTPLLRQFACRR
jgi:hypothetical protein